MTCPIRDCPRLVGDPFGDADRPSTVYGLRSRGENDQRNSEILLVDSAQEDPDAEFSLACQEPYGGHSESQWRRAMAVAEDRLRFEKLLADLSATFVNLPSERLDEEIDSSLKMLVEFLGNDRSTLVKLTKDKKHVLVTHSYAVPGCRTVPVGLARRRPAPLVHRAVSRRKDRLLRRLPEDLPPEANDREALLPCARHQVQRHHSAQGGRLGPGRNHLRFPAAAVRVAGRRSSPACK